MTAQIITLLLMLLLPLEVFCASNTCPTVTDFLCLVKHSSQVYKEDFQHWWSIYHYTANKAKKCLDDKDITVFLQLWSANVDGECIEGLTQDTEYILIKNNKYFIQGLLGLSETERALFIKKFCPLFDIAKCLHALETINDVHYKEVASLIIQRIKFKCK